MQCNLTFSASEENGMWHTARKEPQSCLFLNVFVLILTYAHTRWVMIQRELSEVKATEMRFLR